MNPGITSVCSVVSVCRVLTLEAWVPSIILSWSVQPWPPLSFPPSFFTGPVYQGFWHLFQFYQTISLAPIFHLKFCITAYNCHRDHEYRIKTTIEGYSWYYSEFVQEKWGSASIDGCNVYLTMKTGFLQTWQELKEYQSKSWIERIKKKSQMSDWSKGIRK